jgi:MFS family permease
LFSHLSEFIKHKAARATGYIFIAEGFIFGSWAASIPFVRQKFNLDEAQLGLLLLCLEGGILVMNPFSVPLLRKFGAPKASLIFLLIASFFFILPVSMPTVLLTGLSLVAGGAAFSVMNVAMNTCASLIEQQEGKRIMSTCHGLWSSGAMLGSLIVGLAFAFNILPLIYFIGLFIASVFLAIGLRKTLFLVPESLEKNENVGKKSVFILPTKALWLMIIVGICTNLTEGTMADWSAVYMRDVVKSPVSMVGWGFSIYAFFMAAGRFLGDGLIAKYGRKPILRFGGIVVFAGLLLAVFFPNTWMVLLGFAMVGAGVSIGSPILYAAASNIEGMAQGAGLATMNTFAMLGFFGGPVLVGFLAKAFNLQISFGTIAVLVLFWVYFSGKLKIKD